MGYIQQRAITQAMRYSGRVSRSECATLYVVSPLALMEAVLLWPTLQTQACKFHGYAPNHHINIRYRFVKILVIEIFSSVLGLFGLIIGLLVSAKAADFK